jgi:uncharacterized protein YgiM (DUF1202 family)
MNNRRWMVLCMVLGLGLWGCATAETARVEAPPVERPTSYYVGAMEVSLKSAPNPDSSDTGKVTINQQVKTVKRSGAWFLVQANDGSQGWVNDRDLALQPVADFYVRRWGRLRSAPQSGSKSIARIRVNDRVKLLETNPGGWARVTVDRTGNTGWVELDNLSTSKVAVRRYRRPSKGAAKTGEAEEAPAAAGAPPPADQPPAAPGLGPKPAEAAEKPAKKPAPQRKVRPEMFDAF